MRWSSPATRAATGADARAGAVGAVVRRGDAEVAAERLGELGGLAVADAVGDLAHGHAAAGEQLGGAVHADAGQVLAEGGVADLGVGALELAARGGDAAGDVVERRAPIAYSRSTIAVASSNRLVRRETVAGRCVGT